MKNGRLVSFVESEEYLRRLGRVPAKHHTWTHSVDPDDPGIHGRCHRGCFKIMNIIDQWSSMVHFPGVTWRGSCPLVWKKVSGMSLAQDPRVSL